jgi:CHAT domain-containing protein
MDDTLDLSILDSGQSASVVGIARRGGDLAVATLPTGAELQALSAFRQRIDHALRRARAERPQAAELIAFGQQLFQFCIRDDLARLYHRLPDSLVRLHIHANRPDLQALPWEYFQEPAQAPGPKRDRTVVRIVPTIGLTPLVPRPFGSSIRVLFVSADPLDQEGVSWPDVKASIERAFTARIPDRFDITAIEGASQDALTDAVAQHPFDIFHFSGHGEVVGGKGHLVLLDRRTKKSARISADSLAVMLGGKNIQLAVLSACETASGDFASGFAVIAETLVRAGIPAVVANQFPVPDKTVATFVGALYRELLRTGDIDRATSEGRIKLANDPALQGATVLEWGIPTLYRRLLASQLFQP